MGQRFLSVVYNILSIVLLMWQLTVIQDHDMLVMVKSLLEVVEDRKNKFPPQTFQQYPRLNFANLTEYEHADWFRFKKDDMQLLCTELRIPVEFITSSRYRCTGIEGLHILLWRLSFPNKWSFGVKVLVVEDLRYPKSIRTRHFPRQQSVVMMSARYGYGLDSVG